ncbi:hypothetical protein GF348_24110 [candidate division KSB3 bacterium]|nr:hypothetical protein [candidate division KSB3 bacterium]
MSQDRFDEDQYLDVLQNLEFAIIEMARKTPELTDWHVQSAVKALVRHYKAQVAGKEKASPSHLDPLARETYDRLHTMSRFLLGEGKFLNEAGEPVEIPFDAIMPPEMYECLKRIQKSIRRWNRLGGRKGYLNYIDQFLPPGPTRTE